MRPAQENPVHARPGVGKCIPQLPALYHTVRNPVRLHLRGSDAAHPCGKPAVFLKSHRYQAYFPAGDVECHPLMNLPERQMNHPEIAPFILHQITMSAALDHIAPQITIGKYRVAGIGGERPVHGRALGIDHHMPVLRAALRRHQVILPIYPVKMRRLQIPSPCPLPDAP